MRTLAHQTALIRQMDRLARPVVDELMDRADERLDRGLVRTCLRYLKTPTQEDAESLCRALAQYQSDGVILFCLADEDPLLCA